MNEALYQRLLDIARRGEIANYADVAPIVDLDMNIEDDRARISVLLDEISTFEHQNGRPLLSAVVVRRDTNIPGDGFFALASRLRVHAGRDNLAFWVREVTRVHNQWRVP